MEKSDLEFLVEASKVLNSTLDVNALVSLTYDLIVSAVDCETCSLGRLAEKGNRIDVLLAFGKSGRSVKGLTVEAQRGVMGEAVRTGKPVIINDAERLETYRDAMDHKFTFPKRNSLAVPLRRGGNVIGALEAINKEGGDFTPRDRDILVALAEQIAIALDNARLYGRVMREVKERELLYEVGTRISSSLDLNEVLDLILDSLREVVSYDAGGIYLVDPDASDIIAVTTRGYDPEMEKRAELKFGDGIVGWVANNREPVVLGDVRKDERYLNARDTTRSEIVVPLMASGRIVGIINLESDEASAFTEDDLKLIQTFGSQAAISIERAKLHAELLEKRRLEYELELARKIQRFFLPDRLPEIENFDLSAINIPSEQVGGDYYDVISISPGQWGLVVADVFGKGIPASLVMASFRASLLAEIRNNYSISTILQKVNRLIWESVEPERCVTACYGVLDSKARVLTYSNAGHLPPMIISKSGSRRLTRGGMLLGALEDSLYEEDRVELREGEVLLFFTDGLTEAEDSEGEPFGEERLVEIVVSTIDQSCDDIVRSIHQEIWKHSKGKLLDDFTLVVLKAR